MQPLKTILVSLFLFSCLISQAQWNVSFAPATFLQIEYGGNSLFGYSLDSLYVSHDEGQSWSSLNIGLNTGIFYDISIDGDTIYLVTDEGIVYSPDLGNSFFWSWQWPFDNCRSVDVKNGYGWAAVEGWGARSGPNRFTPDSSWTLERGSGIVWSNMSMSSAEVDPNHPERVGYFSGVSAYVTRDSGNTWQGSYRVKEVLNYNNQSYAFAREKYSHDEGISWQDLVMNAMAVTINPLNGDLILASESRGVFQGSPDSLGYIGLGDFYAGEFANNDSVLFVLSSFNQIFSIKFEDIKLLPPTLNAFQNYDDDVFTSRTYSNLWGGNNGVINWNPNLPQFSTEYSSQITRTGYGRSKAITYGPLNHRSTDIESFVRNWDDNTQTFNLNRLFPDYVDPSLKYRKIDSLIFYARLDSTQDTLSLKIDLRDALIRYSSYIVDILPDSNWHKIAIALNQFQGSFDPSQAKFIGLTFDKDLDNEGEAGVLYVDDFYWVERFYQKPSFDNPDDMLAHINEVSFRHFWMAVDPASKFALDRHIWDDLISVDAIGFQLSSYVIAHQNNWVPRAEIENRVEHILHYLLNRCQHAADTNLVIANPLQYASVDGNWAHFLDKNSLARKNTATEFSLFTNALLLAGIHSAQAYFQNTAIDQKADSLIRMTNWNFLFRPADKLMHYDWKPESGFSPYYTDFFTEELDLAFLLGVSSPEPSHRLSDNPYFSPGYRKYCCNEATPQEYTYTAPGASFTYFFLQMYGRFDPSSSRFINTQNALIEDQNYSQQALNYLSYDPRIWGQTALEGAGSNEFQSNYKAYGAGCRFDTHNDPDGTMAVYGGASGILHTSAASIDLIDYYYEELDSLFQQQYAYGFWSPIFGFPDGFHLDPQTTTEPSINSLNYNGPWLSVPRFGIDIGPMLMNIDSYLKEKENEASLRDFFSQHTYLQTNLGTFADLQCQLSTSLPTESGLELSILPNPNNGSFKLQFITPTNQSIQIEAFDSAGRRVFTQTDFYRAGAQKLEMDFSSLADGIYMIQLKSVEGSTTLKFSKY